MSFFLPKNGCPSLGKGQKLVTMLFGGQGLKSWFLVFYFMLITNFYHKHKVIDIEPIIVICNIWANATLEWRDLYICFESILSIQFS
jgi:hypothetical protein